MKCDIETTHSAPSKNEDRLSRDGSTIIKIRRSVVRPSSVYNENFYTGETVYLYWGKPGPAFRWCNWAFIGSYTGLSLAPSHDINQSGLIVNRTVRIKVRWNCKIVKFCLDTRRFDMASSNIGNYVRVPICLHHLIHRSKVKGASNPKICLHHYIIMIQQEILSSLLQSAMGCFTSVQ